jgi:CBS domain containing-hemolysin-like protein
VPLDRALLVCHLALLIVAGAAASEAIRWWHQPVASAIVRLVLTAVFLLLVSELIPLGLATLLPRAAASLNPLARHSLTVFRPLLGLITLVEVKIHTRLPAPARPTDSFGPEHRDMLDGVLSLGEATVAEAMTPRLDVEAVNSESRWREVVDQLRRSDHARLPVYSDDLDTIVGILYAKDLAAAITGRASVPDSWRAFVRPAPFVPESKTLTAQLRDFQRGPSDLAVVVDEFGGTSGIITLEDVLEEVVGELYGEYDSELEPALEREGEDRFWVDGGFALDDFAELLGTEMDNEDVSTVGGLVYSELGRVPKPGEELRIAEFRVVVEQVIRRRIKRVYFERSDAGSELPGSEGVG